MLQHIEELHPNKMIFSWGMGFTGYLLDFGGKLVNKKKNIQDFMTALFHTPQRKLVLFFFASALQSVAEERVSHIISEELL